MANGTKKDQARRSNPAHHWPAPATDPRESGKQQRIFTCACVGIDRCHIGGFRSAAFNSRHVCSSPKGLDRFHRRPRTNLLAFDGCGPQFSRLPSWSRRGPGDSPHLNATNPGSGSWLPEIAERLRRG